VEQDFSPARQCLITSNAQGSAGVGAHFSRARDTVCFRLSAVYELKMPEASVA